MRIPFHGPRRAFRLARSAAFAVGATILFASVASSAAAFTCTSTLKSGCMQPSRPTGLWMNERTSHRDDNVVWKWFLTGLATPVSFADPTTTNDYAFCLYSENGNQSSLLFAGTAPAGSQCGGRTCWRQTGSGFRYRTGTGLPDGITKIYLLPQGEGRARIIVKGRGTNLHLPLLPVPLPMRVQLQSEDGQCWEADYPSGSVSQDDTEHFRGRALQP